MATGVINRNYYDAAEKGRVDRDMAVNRQAHNALSQQAVQQGEVLNQLRSNPQATPEQYARAGRSDVANALTNQAGAQEDQRTQFAKQMMQVAQYGLQSPTPKQFIEKTAPQLVEQYGPGWATATDDQIKASLQEAVGIFGPMAGVGPAQPKERGLINTVGPDGRPVRGEDVPGAPVYEAPRAPGTNAPSGYRVSANGNLEPIPGGPADPNTPNTRDDTRIFAKADKLRDEFNNQSKDFIAVGDSFSTVQAAAKDPSAAGDLSMIFAYMKMLDPNSVVREQEFANAQNAAGVPDRIRNQWNKVLEGERLNPNQRDDFIAQAKKVYEVRKTRHKSIVGRYTEIAKRNKVNPDDVVGDMGVFEDAVPNASQQTPPAGPTLDEIRAKYGR